MLMNFYSIYEIPYLTLAQYISLIIKYLLWLYCLIMKIMILFLILQVSIIHPWFPTNRLYICDVKKFSYVCIYINIKIMIVTKIARHFSQFCVLFFVSLHNYFLPEIKLLKLLLLIIFYTLDTCFHNLNLAILTYWSCFIFFFF